MHSCKFTLSKHPHGHNALGFYGSRTSLETPGPGSYDPYPFLNPPAQRMRRTKSLPDRAPGFVNVVDRGIQKWRPEPFSVSRVQSEQPLVHYASATFWDWPAQRRQFEERRMVSMNRRGSNSGGGFGRRMAQDSGSSDFDPDLPRAPIGLAPPGLAGKRWQGREDTAPKQRPGFDDHTQLKRDMSTRSDNSFLPSVPRSRMAPDGLYP